MVQIFIWKDIFKIALCVQFYQYKHAFLIRFAMFSIFQYLLYTKLQTFKDSKVTLIVNALYRYIVAIALLAAVNTYKL